MTIVSISPRYNETYIERLRRQIPSLKPEDISGSFGIAHEFAMRIRVEMKKNKTSSGYKNILLESIYNDPSLSEEVKFMVAEQTSDRLVSAKWAYSNFSSGELIAFSNSRPLNPLLFESAISNRKFTWDTIEQMFLWNDKWSIKDQNLFVKRLTCSRRTDIDFTIQKFLAIIDDCKFDHNIVYNAARKRYKLNGDIPNSWIKKMLLDD